MGTEQVTSVEYRDEYNGLGIDEQAVTVSLYPNPATEHISVLTSSDIISLQIYDQRGQVVELPQAYFIGKQAELNINELASGMYHLVVRTTNGISTQLFGKE